jgi:two-component system sensor histidine kinase YesM
MFNCKNKEIKKSLMKQVSILLVLILITYLIIFFKMVTSYVTDFEVVSETMQKQNEVTIQNNIERIEMFISKIYSDSVLLEEFLRYFDNNVEGYLSDKLDDIKPDERNVDFINECKNFVRETDYVVKEVVFRSQYSYNIIQFSQDGSFQLKFSIPLKDINNPNTM